MLFYVPLTVAPAGPLLSLDWPLLVGSRTSWAEPLVSLPLLLLFYNLFAMLFSLVGNFIELDSMKEPTLLFLWFS